MLEHLSADTYVEVLQMLCGQITPHKMGDPRHHTFIRNTGTCLLCCNDLPQALMHKWLHWPGLKLLFPYHNLVLETQDWIKLLNCIGNVGQARQLIVCAPTEFYRKRHVTRLKYDDEAATELLTGPGTQKSTDVRCLHSILDVLDMSVMNLKHLTHLYMDLFPVHPENIPQLDSIFRQLSPTLSYLSVWSQQFVPSASCGSSAGSTDRNRDLQSIMSLYDAPAKFMFFLAVSRLDNLRVLGCSAWRHFVGTDIEAVQAIVAPLLSLSKLRAVKVKGMDDCAAFTAVSALPFEDVAKSESSGVSASDEG